MICREGRERRGRREAEWEVDGFVGCETVASNGGRLMVDEAMLCYENGGGGAGCDVEEVWNRRCGRTRYG